MAVEYGKSFSKWRESSSKPWATFTTHEFVVRLGNGMLAEDAFVRYLRQDYIFLLHFARAWALAVVKSDNLDEMRMLLIDQLKKEISESTSGQYHAYHLRCLLNLLNLFLFLL